MSVQTSSELHPITVKRVISTINSYPFKTNEQFKEYFRKYENSRVPEGCQTAWDEAVKIAKNRIQGNDQKSPEDVFKTVFKDVVKEVNSKSNQQTGAKIAKAKQLLTELPNLQKQYEGGLNEFERRFKAQFA